MALTKYIFMLLRGMKGIAEVQNRCIKEIRQRNDRRGLNLNVGSGNQVIVGFKSLDISSEWYGKGRAGFIEYNMMVDNLPFDTLTVDNIYCSHVIEHLPDHAVDRFLSEAHRVLKVGGVLRIACPDAEFLWEVSSFDNNYWDWRRDWFDDSRTAFPSQHADRNRSDFFVREIATPSCRWYVNKRRDIAYDNTLFDSGYQRSIQRLQEGLRFDPKFPGDHINAWDFNKVCEHSRRVGFTKIVRSKRGASVSMLMQHPDFDRTQPQMSLYVDLVKTLDGPKGG